MALVVLSAATLKFVALVALVALSAEVALPLRFPLKVVAVRVFVFALYVNPESINGLWFPVDCEATRTTEVDVSVEDVAEILILDALVALVALDAEVAEVALVALPLRFPLNVPAVRVFDEGL